MSGISAHMIVKNEDQWVYFALQSILPYADQILVTDTGSTDQTVAIIKSISSPKIKFSRCPTRSAEGLTRVRTTQLHSTKTPWIWIIDADEIYPKITAQECLAATGNNQYEGVVVRRFDLLGDIYHRQVESVGSYNLFAQRGHLLVRLINQDKIKGLTYQGDYPSEGFFDGKGRSILTHDPSLWSITHNYLYHTMYLKRSSQGSNLPMLNRGKYKIETGIAISTKPPEVFFGSRPSFVPDPLLHRSRIYELAAGVITPIKNLKRKLL